MTASDALVAWAEVFQFQDERLALYDALSQRVVCLKLISS